MSNILIGIIWKRVNRKLRRKMTQTKTKQEYTTKHHDINLLNGWIVSLLVWETERKRRFGSKNQKPIHSFQSYSYDIFVSILILSIKLYAKILCVFFSLKNSFRREWKFFFSNRLEDSYRISSILTFRLEFVFSSIFFCYWMGLFLTFYINRFIVIPVCHFNRTKTKEKFHLSQCRS